MELSTEFRWTFETIRRLIDLYQENPCLWDTAAEAYKDRVKKNSAFLLISSELNVDIKEVQRKLHNLRNQFSQELKKINMVKSGMGTGEKYFTKWPYFEALKFIEPTVVARRGISNMVSKLCMPYLFSICYFSN